MARVADIDVDSIASKLRRIVGEIDSVLSRREQVRDEMIRLSRDVIRLSGWVINAVQRGRLDEAERHLSEMRRVFKEFMEKARSDDYLFYSGLVWGTLAEYVEAEVFYSLVVRGELPGPEELGVPEVPYLQGLGDAIGELRRLALDLMRLDRLEEAERLLDLMEAMYNELRVLEYPDALIPGVRRKVDVARRLVDDTKALLLEVKGRREVAQLLSRAPSGGLPSRSEEVLEGEGAHTTSNGGGGGAEEG